MVCNLQARCDRQFQMNSVYGYINLVKVETAVQYLIII